MLTGRSKSKNNYPKASSLKYDYNFTPLNIESTMGSTNEGFFSCTQFFFSI